MSNIIYRPIHCTATLLLLIPHLILLALVLRPIADQLGLRIMHNKRLTDRRTSIETIVAWRYGRRPLRTHFQIPSLLHFNRCPLLLHSLTILTFAAVAHTYMFNITLSLPPTTLMPSRLLTCASSTILHMYLPKVADTCIHDASNYDRISTYSTTTTSKHSLHIPNDHCRTWPHGLVGRGLLAGARSNQTSPHPLRLIVDSGASFHVHPHLSHLTNLRPCTDRITGIDHKPHKCPQMGDLKIAVKDSKHNYRQVLVTNVRYCPSCPDSLISVGQLWKEGRVETKFRDEGSLQTPDNHVFPLERQRGLYVLRSIHINKAAPSPSPSTNVERAEGGTDTSDRALFSHTVHAAKSFSHIASLSPDIAAAHLHRRLHLGSKTLSKLPQLTADTPDNVTRARTNSCPDCVTANAAHTTHTSSRYKESLPGRLIHSDIAGPFINSVKGHHKYLLVLVDDHTRFKFAFPLVDRADAPGVIRAFIASFNKVALKSGGTMSAIGSLHTDGAGEFTSRKFKETLSSLLIDKTESPPEIHALNGVAERAIRSIFAHVRSDLEASHAPKSFWPYACAHAVDILNRTTCPPHNRCTSYEALTGEKPRIMSIWPFGCQAFAVVPRALLPEEEYHRQHSDTRNAHR